MNSLKKFGSGLYEQAEPTRQVFQPLLRAKEKEILGYTRKMFKYGATDRHYLDVYYPHFTGKAAVLFYVYGGGYVSGAKVLDPPDELQYKNIGAFFAKEGFVTVIADYRIMPDIKFPDPSIDLRDAFAWVVANAGAVSYGMSAKADLCRVFFMGHSAGSTSIATLMLLPDLLPANLRNRIVGLVLLSGAYDFRGAPSTSPEFLRQYFGPLVEDVRKREPLGLLENAPKAILSDFPSVLALIGEYDFPPLVQSHGNFVPVLKSKVSSSVEELLMQGHNHLSPGHCLFSGEGEDWGFEVSNWMQSRYR